MNTYWAHHTRTHNTKKTRTHIFKILHNNNNTIWSTIFLSPPLDQIRSQVQISTSLLTYGDQGLRIALSKASIPACAFPPEDVSTAGFRNVAHP